MTTKHKRQVGTVVPLERITRTILVIRGHKVMLDTDLADLYGVTTKRLNEQVRRNRERFPEDFLFQLTNAERAEVVANCDHLSKLKFSHNLPYAFTEHGAIMAASVLNSPRAVEVSVYVVRAFVQLRELAVTHKELSRKLDELERRVTGHDQAIAGLIRAIRELMTPAGAEEETPHRFRVLGGQVIPVYSARGQREHPAFRAHSANGHGGVAPSHHGSAGRWMIECKPHNAHC